jgi:hypothetical protein
MRLVSAAQTLSHKLFESSSVLEKFLSERVIAGASSSGDFPDKLRAGHCILSWHDVLVRMVLAEQWNSCMLSTNQN